MGGAQVVSIIDADMVIRSDFYQRMLPYLQTERDALVLAPQVRSRPVWELGASGGASQTQAACAAVCGLAWPSHHSNVWRVLGSLWA